MHIEKLKLLSVPAPTDPTPSLSQADKYVIPAILELSDRLDALQMEVDELKALIAASGGGTKAMTLQEAVRKFADSIDPNATIFVIE